MIVRRLRDDDGVGDQNVVDSDVDNNCDQCGEHHDRENHGVVQAPFIMVAIAVAAQWCEGNKNYNTATIARQRTGRSEEKCGGGRRNGEHRSCMQRGGENWKGCDGVKDSGTNGVSRNGKYVLGKVGTGGKKWEGVGACCRVRFCMRMPILFVRRFVDCCIKRKL